MRRSDKDFRSKFPEFYNNFNIHLEKVQEPIYHYTSPEGLNSILGNSKLRFTDRFYLNDYSEGIYVVDLCLQNIDGILPTSNYEANDNFKRAVIESLKARKEHFQQDDFFVYQCSFSTNPDSLCLWNYYANRSRIDGYNLKLSANMIDEYIVLDYKPGKSTPFNHGKVIYNQDEQIKILKDILLQFKNFSDKAEKEDRISFYSIAAKYAVKKICEQGVFFKQSCFSVEQEYRIAIKAMVEDDNKFAVLNNPRQTMVRNGIVVPYVDISFEPQIISGITVSPTSDAELARQSCLSAFGGTYTNLTNKTIIKSRIPVRF